MTNRNIVAGQPVDCEKVAFSRLLRHTMTLAEIKLWEVLRNRRFAGLKFRRQQIIDRFIADFYCSAVGLVIELDGSVHEKQAEYDRLRDRIMEVRGLRVLRIPNHRLDGELELVLQEIAYLVWSQTSPPNPLSEAERGDRND